MSVGANANPYLWSKPEPGSIVEARLNRQVKNQNRVTSFKVIRARAEKRKGGAKALSDLLPPAPSSKSLVKLRDDRVLAEKKARCALKVPGSDLQEPNVLRLFDAACFLIVV